MRKSAAIPEGHTPIIRLVDESRLYRKIPIVRRLVPSFIRRAERIIRPGARTMRITPIKFVGIDAGRVHIFGDSHTWTFGGMAGVEIHYLLGVTMHRVGRDGIAVFGLDDMDLKPGDALGFCFGEIDVRAHFAKQRDRFLRDPSEVIETLVARYIATLKEMQRLYPSSPIIIFCVAPPAGRKYPNFRHYRISYPAPPDEDRIAWTKEINGVLRREAARAGFGYLDQYTPFVNDKGLLNRDMTADGLHLTPNPSGKDVQELICVFEGVRPLPAGLPG